MSRRDTIIVAVLVNAGLLIVLFASALKSGPSVDEIAAVPPPVLQEAAPEFAAQKAPAPVAGDEVDLAISQFQNAVAAAPAPQAPSMPMTSPVSEPAPSFADDLKAISIPETQVVAAPAAPAMQTLTTPMPQQNKPAPEFFEVKVKKGDVLEKIARHHHTSVAEIMKANKLTSSNLKIGQVLKIPNKSIKKAEPLPVANATPAAATDTGAKYYTVKKGDNPWTIAVKNRLKVEDLLKLNHMTEEQARRLKPGDQLRIQ